MPPLLEIERPSHLQPSTQQLQQQSRPDIDPLIEEENEDSDDDRTLADLKRKRGGDTSQEGASSPSGELSPSHRKKPRVTARNNNDEQPRLVKCCKICTIFIGFAFCCFPTLLYFSLWFSSPTPNPKDSRQRVEEQVVEDGAT
jgi:hypothetical protein